MDSPCLVCGDREEYSKLLERASNFRGKFLDGEINLDEDSVRQLYSDMTELLKRNEAQRKYILHLETELKVLRRTEPFINIH